MITTSLGLAVVTLNPVSLIATLLLITSIQIQVRAVEEPYLTRVHGTIYTAYATRVGHFLPTAGRVHSDGHR
jgi:protein-S-isoprenylcysteine O-methyltransferase Ste14